MMMKTRERRLKRRVRKNPSDHFARNELRKI